MKGNKLIKREDWWSPLDTLRERISDIFDDWSLFNFSRTPSLFEDGVWTPQVDLHETKNEYVISAVIPGVTEKDINIEATKDGITITGERKKESEDKGKNYYRREQMYGKFSRSFNFPVEINTEKIDAKYRNGVLEVKLPKAEEHQAKSIKVQVK